MARLTNRRRMWVAACCRRNGLTLSEAHRVALYHEGEQTSAEYDALPPALKRAVDDVKNGCFIDGVWNAPPPEARFRCRRCGAELDARSQKHGTFDIFASPAKYRPCPGRVMEV